MRTWPIAIALAAMLSLPAMAQRGSTLQILSQRVPEIAFVDTPFEQVMEWIADFTQLNIVVRWQNLEDAGLERDKPLSLRAKNLRLSQVLWMIMNEAGGSDLKLAYRASGRLLVMSTDEDLNREMLTRVYDVSDLLTRVPRFSGRTTLDPSQALQQGGGGGLEGGGGGGGGQIFQGQSDEEPEDAGDGTEMQRLVELILDTIEPDSWRERGSGTGSITVFRGLLIVRNTILVHQKLGGYIPEKEATGR